MKKIVYFLLKLQSYFFEKYKLNKYKISDNGYFIKNNEKKIDKILIYLDNKYLAHIGDQIFFEPLMQILKKNNLNVNISVTKPLESYFLNLGYQVDRVPNFERYDLIISRSDFFYELHKKGNIFLIKTTCLKERVCNVILNETINFLKIEQSNEIEISKYMNINSKNNYINKIKNDIKSKYVIFSNYIDSGSMFSNKKNNKKLEDFIKKYSKKSNIKIIHVGTENDMLNDNKKYDFVNIDLRGKTDIEDLFFLISLKNVEEYIGMDNFIMHLFFIYNKKTNICIRTKGSKKRKENIIKYVNPPINRKSESEIFYIN